MVTYVPLNGDLEESFISSSIKGTAISQDIHEIYLETQGINYSIQNDEDKVHILKNVSAQFLPGSLLALMGPSGAGKTTLLNILGGYTSGGDLTGSIKCNSMEGIPPGFKNISSFIPQDDILLSSLTPRETFMYTARLRLPKSLSDVEREQRVNEILKLLSLDGCADTRVGDVDHR